MSTPLEMQMRAAEENFAAVKALAVSRKRGCVAARKALKDAARFGLDACAYKFFPEANGGAGATIGWSIVRTAREMRAVVMIPKIDQMWSDA